MDENKSISNEVKPETRLQKYMRGALRWVLVALLAFGLGALLITFALYVPTWRKLDKANADLEDANTTITSKTDQITTLQAGTEILQKDLDSATLHMDVLKALSGVRGASLAVAADDYAGARLSLIQASEALDYPVWLAGDGSKRRTHCYATKRRSGIDRCANRPQVSAAGAGSVDAKLGATGGKPVPQPINGEQFNSILTRRERNLKSL